MSDEQIRALASHMGISSNWTDLTNTIHEVSIATLRSLLTSLSIPCSSDDEIRNSFSALEAGLFRGRSTFITARVEQPVVLPRSLPAGTIVEVVLESGATRAVSSIEGLGGALTLPPFETPGYHKVNVQDREYTVAVAPHRCVSIRDQTHKERAWGLGAQIYSLRRKGDGGIGDFGSTAALASAAAAQGADALAISPVHALYSAIPQHFSPYSPSSRLLYNPLHADPRAVFDAGIVASVLEELGLSSEFAELETMKLIDWPRASAAKMKLLRGLFSRMYTGQIGLDAIAGEFERFKATCPAVLRDHALFEAVHAHKLALNPHDGYWRNWAEDFRRPDAQGVERFVVENEREISFHIFLQWLTGRSYAECQRICREGGMKIGLIADLAIGMDQAGSHAWSRQSDILTGLSIGAPPDYYNADGQSWGLTSFSPRGLLESGFEPFIETLRAVMRHSGGVRIDHVMGLRRLWLVPDGAKATEGAYLEYPAENMFRLLALESWRHNSIVIGEDLGTVPEGFRESLNNQALAGMRVLRFERDVNDGYIEPQYWEREAVAMTTTHDLISTAGWWAGNDLEFKFNMSQEQSEEDRHSIRAWDRGLLWGSFQHAGIVQGERPEPWDTIPVVDAAVKFIAQTPCALSLLAIEDALGVRDQPNVPGTTTEAPNWRHRLDDDAGELLANEATQRRLQILQDAASDTSA